jgi:hypothetical protein
MANDQIERLPWKNDVKNYTGCNFAYADLTYHIPQFLAVDGKFTLKLSSQPAVLSRGSLRSKRY